MFSGKNMSSITVKFLISATLYLARAPSIFAPPAKFLIWHLYIWRGHRSFFQRFFSPMRLRKVMGSCQAPLFAQNCAARLFDVRYSGQFSLKMFPERRNLELPSEYNLRNRMTGLEISTRVKTYIQSTRKQVRKLLTPLGPKGVGNFRTCFLVDCM